MVLVGQAWIIQVLDGRDVEDPRNVGVVEENLSACDKLLHCSAEHHLNHDLLWSPRVGRDQSTCCVQGTPWEI
jgi:hypothetical protein